MTDVRSARTWCTYTERWPALLAAALVTSCGAGTAAVVSGGGGSGGGGNAPPSMSGFTVLDPKLAADARVRFVLSDAEADPTTIQLFYQALGDSVHPLTHAGANPVVLATSSQGVEYRLPWDFAAEPELPHDAHFLDGVQVFARIAGGSQEILLGANGTSIGLGNDAPVVGDITVPAQEVVGIVGVECQVFDSSNDAVSIQVEYDIQGDVPDAGWQLARPALADATPTFAITGLTADHLGTTLAFFWDTNVDLAELEHDVKLRFKAQDSVVAGGFTESPGFHVDNNAEPIATVSGDLLLVNPDQRAGIPIPYIVRDEESDEVQVVFQWKRPNEDFPPLPDTPAEIHAILADPVLRKERHVCTEHPTWVEGRVVPIDANSVRLPELATSASSILAHGLVGRELEILRASKIPKPIAATWATHPLNHPVAALPVGDGIEALVLDRANAGAWRLRQIDLATGVVTREVVSSAPGEASAMALERDEHSVLIASDIGGAWQLERVMLADGEITPLIGFDGTTEAGVIRGLAIESQSSALATVGGSLIRLDFAEGRTPGSVTLFDELATPWGIVLDPLNTNRIYLAERDAETDDGNGRLISIRLDTLEKHDVSERSIPLLDDVFEHIFFDRPQSLAFDRSGTRLLVVTQTDSSEETHSLHALALGSGGQNRAFLIATELPGDNASVAVGAEGLLLLALSSEDDLALGGGIEQRRAIDGLEIAHRDVHVSASFSPALSATQTFRVRSSSLVGRPSPLGTHLSFVWDSADLSEGGRVKFRAVPMDAERGVDGATEAAKVIRSALDSEPVALGNASVTSSPDTVTTADLDGDGDLDIASANFVSSTVTVFFQESPGVFGSAPLSLGDASVTSGAYCVAAADLDGDGDLDLVSANYGSNTLTVFFQVSTGIFDPAPLTIGNAVVTNQPVSVAAADLDGDGDLDIASANYGSNTLTVFFQTSPGVFDSSPLSLGNELVTGGPQSLTAADLDGDGDLDIASANTNSQTVTLFFQVSPGGFGSIPLSLGTADFPIAIAAADLDGDGDLDIASGNAFDSTIAIYFQVSPGAFGSTPLQLGNSSVSGYPASVAAADFDGDGDLDIASANQASHTLTVFFQESPGVFGSAPVSIGNASVTNGAYSVAAADLDGDGDIDLVSANIGSNSVAVFLQTSPGKFGSTPLSLGSLLVTNQPFAITAADLDGDGDLDLASANFSGNTLTVFFQESPGAFGRAPLSLGNASVTSAPDSVVAADLDGDGDLDLASANQNSSSLTVFFQTSPGVFGSTPLSLGNASVTSAPLSVVAADLDGDGDLDLASANFSSNTLTVFFQDSAGVFGRAPLSLGNPGVTGGPVSVVAADVDGDGDLDLASANYVSSTLTVFFQVSPGNFDPVPLSVGNAIVTNQPVSVAAADLDSDGDLDLTSANRAGNTLTVFFQTSPGVFGTAPLSLGNASVTSTPVSVIAADLDGDGDLDLSSAIYGSNTLTAFFQDSPGVFGSTPLSLGNASVTGGPQSVTAADLDGDGDLDLASPNQFSHTLTIFWNNH